ncbi:IS1595 transposase [Xanthomonas fragariae]|nr:IS1595 transposase [Xanthomonas fragariae]
MRINAMQFQAGLSMSEFFASYGTAAKSYRAVYKWWWPQGFRCPCCAGRAWCCDLLPTQRLPSSDQSDDGTMFEGTKLPPRTRMPALHLLTSTKTNMAALELMRHLGGNYKSAWRMKHKIMQVMAEREATRRLSGFVQIDATFTAPSYVVIEPVRSFDNASLKDWTAHRLARECEVYTDGLACFRRLEDAGHAHTTLDTGGGRAATEAAGDRWVNVVLGNLKRAIGGVYHAITQGKYARRYLAEAAYRFNRRFQLRELLPRLTKAMMQCKPCPESVLRAASNSHN